MTFDYLKPFTKVFWVKLIDIYSFLCQDFISKTSRCNKSLTKHYDYTYIRIPRMLRHWVHELWARLIEEQIFSFKTATDFRHSSHFLWSRTEPNCYFGETALCICNSLYEPCSFQSHYMQKNFDLGLRQAYASTNLRFPWDFVLKQNSWINFFAISKWLHRQQSQICIEFYSVFPWLL